MHRQRQADLTPKPTGNPRELQQVGPCSGRVRVPALSTIDTRQATERMCTGLYVDDR